MPVTEAVTSQAQTISWQEQDAGSVGRGAVLNSVSFVDATHGWAAGYGDGGESGFHNGLIVATTDGGGTWQAQDTSSARNTREFYSVNFVDAMHGWAVGRQTDDSGFYIGCVIVATSDGGATWHVQEGNTGSHTGLYSVNFVDATHGWAAGYGDGYGLIFATTDGGATWYEQDASDTGSGAGLYSVNFVDASHGWAVGGRGDNNGDHVDGVILATSDGGTTWQAQDASGAGSPTGLYSVDFVDTLHGWAVGKRGGSNGSEMGHVGVILATSDGGATWQAQDASSAGTCAELNSVVFVDAMHGWAVGLQVDDSGRSTALILATSDGGRSWQPQDTNGAGDRGESCSVNFIDVTHGWVVGSQADDSGCSALVLAANR